MFGLGPSPGMALSRRRRLSLPRALLWALLSVAGPLAAGCDQYRASGEPASSGAVTPELTPAPTPPAEPMGTSPCGGVGNAGPVVTIETLRRADRSCVDPRAAVVVRCDPALDPIAILDAGGDDERIFLGGPFAVPVPEVPQEANAIGFGPTGRYYLSRDDDPLLYLETGSHAERWLALARRRQVKDPPTALMVGDSILDGSSEELTTALAEWTLTIDAVVGRSSSGGIAVVQSAFTEPDVAVLELGTNDHDAAAFRANADAILAAPAVADADLIVWVTARNPDEDTPGVNHEIFSALGAIPNATIADWDRFVPPDALNGDGVHLAAGSEGVFAEFLAPVLETWNEAVHRRGPARCAKAAVGALP